MNKRKTIKAISGFFEIDREEAEFANSEYFCIQSSGFIPEICIGSIRKYPGQAPLINSSIYNNRPP